MKSITEKTQALLSELDNYKSDGSVKNDFQQMKYRHIAEAIRAIMNSHDIDTGDPLPFDEPTNTHTHELSKQIDIFRIKQPH